MMIISYILFGLGTLTLVVMSIFIYLTYKKLGEYERLIDNVDTTNINITFSIIQFMYILAITIKILFVG